MQSREPGNLVLSSNDKKDREMDHDKVIFAATLLANAAFGEAPAALKNLTPKELEAAFDGACGKIAKKFSTDQITANGEIQTLNKFRQSIVK